MYRLRGTIGLRRSGRSKRPLVLALVALVALLAWTILAHQKIRPFSTWYYQFAWYSLLLFLDAVVASREEGEFPWLGNPRLARSLWLWSVPVWLVFELLNFRITNWYYVFAPEALVARRINALLAFGTVLPAIFLGQRLLSSFRAFRRAAGPRLRISRSLPGALVTVGVLFLALAMWRPRLFFPLVWGSLTLLLEPWNYVRCRERSLLADLESGRYGRTLRLLATGAGIGLLWELFNALSETRWIYTVPGLEGGKLFEMPVLGYLGFPVFAVDCFVLYQALVTLGVAHGGWGAAPQAMVEDGETGMAAATRSVPEPPGRNARGRRVRAYVAWTAAALFSFFALAGLDRWTVDSSYPDLGDLPGIEGEALARLWAARVRGVRELAAADPGWVSRRLKMPAAKGEQLVNAARLTVLRGLGSANAEALAEFGMVSVCGLARASPEQVVAAIRAHRSDPHAGHLPRVREWIRAARSECG